MSQDFRYEIKFVLNETNFSIYSQWCNEDTFIYKKYPQRIINSLYFDDSNFSSVKDNLSGISDRFKLRLRWYGDQSSNEQNPIIEQKIKQGRLGSKNYFPIEDLKDKLFDCSIEDISHKVSQELIKSPMMIDYSLAPILFVRYEREYYEDHNDIRITIDKNIQFSLPVNSNTLPQHTWVNYNKKILELKFKPEKKDYASRLIRNLNLVPTRHSKYLSGLAMYGLVNYV